MNRKQQIELYVKQCQQMIKDARINLESNKNLITQKRQVYNQSVQLLDMCSNLIKNDFLEIKNNCGQDCQQLAKIEILLFIYNVLEIQNSILFCVIKDYCKIQQMIKVNDIVDCINKQKISMMDQLLSAYQRKQQEIPTIKTQTYNLQQDSESTKLTNSINKEREINDQSCLRNRLLQNTISSNSSKQSKETDSICIISQNLKFIMNTNQISGIFKTDIFYHSNDPIWSTIYSHIVSNIIKVRKEFAIPLQNMQVQILQDHKDYNQQQINTKQQKIDKLDSLINTCNEEQNDNISTETNYNSDDFDYFNQKEDIQHSQSQLGQNNMITDCSINEITDFALQTEEQQDEATQLVQSTDSDSSYCSQCDCCDFVDDSNKQNDKQSLPIQQDQYQQNKAKDRDIQQKEDNNIISKKSQLVFSGRVKPVIQKYKEINDKNQQLSSESQLIIQFDKQNQSLCNMFKKMSNQQLIDILQNHVKQNSIRKTYKSKASQTNTIKKKSGITQTINEIVKTKIQFTQTSQTFSDIQDNQQQLIMKHKQIKQEQIKQCEFGNQVNFNKESNEIMTQTDFIEVSNQQKNEIDLQCKLTQVSKKIKTCDCDFDKAHQQKSFIRNVIDDVTDIYNNYINNRQSTNSQTTGQTNCYDFTSLVIYNIRGSVREQLIQIRNLLSHQCIDTQSNTIVNINDQMCQEFHDNITILLNNIANNQYENKYALEKLQQYRKYINQYYKQISNIS